MSRTNTVEGFLVIQFDSDREYSSYPQCPQRTFFTLEYVRKGRKTKASVSVDSLNRNKGRLWTLIRINCIMSWEYQNMELLIHLGIIYFAVCSLYNIVLWLEYVLFLGQEILITTFFKKSL